MRLHRLTNLRLALILALILPFQAFAALSNCVPNDLVAHAAVQAGHCEHAAPSTVHHHCGACCVLAAANHLSTPLPPRGIAQQLNVAPIKAPPSIAGDRLDRPPRVRFT
jgi:hypothetical protein